MAHNRTLGEEYSMKKTSNEYADDRLIDLRQLDHLQFDDVHEAYHLDWSSMLLLMRWLHDGEDSTIVIDRRGRLLNVERRYSELISELSQEYHVYRNTMTTLYKKTNAQSVGCVSGRHRLVPLTGLRNRAAIFICADNLSPHGFDSSRRGCSVLSFDGYDHQTIRVMINVAIDTIKRNLNAAAKVSHALIEHLEMVRKNYEGERCCERHPDFNHLDDLHQLENRVRYEVLENALDSIANKLYGHPMDEEFKRLLKKQLIAPYDGTNH